MTSYTNYKEYLTFKSGRMEKQPRYGSISPHDADIIREFLDEYVTERKLAKMTALNNATYITLFIQKAGNISEITTQDIYRLVSEIQETWKDNSIRKFYTVFRHFVEWLNERGYNTKIDIKRINQFKPPKRNLSTKKAADMLTEDEIGAMLNACRNSRDRAVIAVMFEGGLRSIEMSRLKWGDLKIDDKGIVLNTKEKTGKPRRVRLRFSLPYINAWKADYPGKPENGAPVFLNFKGNPGAISYQALKKLVNVTAKRAGIERHVHNHLLRHSRVTNLIELGVHESTIKKMMWGSVNTPMLATYEHISDDAMDEELLSAQGYDEIIKEKKSARLKADQCPVCYELCGPTQNFCPYCGTSLTEDAKQSQQIEMREIEHVPEEVPNVFEKILKLEKELNALKAKYIQ